MAKMMGRNIRPGMCVCLDCGGPGSESKGRAREIIEWRNEIDAGIEDYWRETYDAIGVLGHYVDDPWIDVHLRWHYPWGESRDEPIHQDWEDELDSHV